MFRSNASKKRDQEKSIKHKPITKATTMVWRPKYNRSRQHKPATLRRPTRKDDNGNQYETTTPKRKE